MSKSFISDLSSTPASNTDLGGVGVAGSNLLSTGDNAMRALGSMLAMLYADLGGVNTVGGTATAVTVTTAEAWTAYGSSDGQIKNGTLLAIKMTAAATGAATINVNVIGNKAIERQGDTAIQANDWLANATVLLKYDTAYNSAAGAWVLMNPAALPTNGGTMTGLLDLSGAAAGQIKFPATQNSSSNANTNDDYEEGSHTSGLAFGGGTTGITYSEQPGAYTKYGRGVTVVGDFVLTAKGSSTGSAAITGLPFGIQGDQTPFLPKVAGMSSLTGAVKGSAAFGGTTISLFQSGSAGDSTITNSSFSGTDSVIYGGAYMTST